MVSSATSVTSSTIVRELVDLKNKINSLENVDYHNNEDQQKAGEKNTTVEEDF